MNTLHKQHIHIKIYQYTTKHKHKHTHIVNKSHIYTQPQISKAKTHVFTHYKTESYAPTHYKTITQENAHISISTKHTPAHCKTQNIHIITL